MKICVYSSTVFPVPLQNYGGLEQIAWHCAKGLAEKGHQVTLVAPMGSSCPNVEIVSVCEPGQWDEKKMYGKVWQKLLEFNDGGVIIDHSWAKWTYLLKMESLLTCPVLGVCHATITTMYQSLPPNIEKPCFVCISEDQRSHFEAFHGRSARTCLNGIDLDYYKPMNVPRSDRFLFLARFSTVKSPDICEDVCSASGVGLDLVGDTSITNEPQYLELCKSKADGKQIKIIGGVSRGESVWWMSQARGLLHLTRNFREPYGLAPVESQACGSPVIGWRYGALKETVDHGNTGFLVSSVEETIELLKSKAIDSIDRKRCRDWASQFSINRMIDRYEVLCQEALDGGW